MSNPCGLIDVVKITLNKVINPHPTNRKLKEDKRQINFLQI